jgi:hypothetical protein
VVVVGGGVCGLGVVVPVGWHRTKLGGKLRYG